jgi:hypothetical protein
VSIIVPILSLLEEKMYHPVLARAVISLQFRESGPHGARQSRSWRSQSISTENGTISIRFPQFRDGWVYNPDQKQIVGEIFAKTSPIVLDDTLPHIQRSLLGDFPRVLSVAVTVAGRQSPSATPGRCWSISSSIPYGGHAAL